MLESNTTDFMKRLEKHPDLLKRFEQLLCVVENSTGELQKASEAEMRVIEELREMGNEALTAWGERRVSTLIDSDENTNGYSRVGKKNSGGIPPMGKSR